MLYQLKILYKTNLRKHCYQNINEDDVQKYKINNCYHCDHIKLNGTGRQGSIPE